MGGMHLECAGLVSFPFLQGLKSQMKVRPRARLYVYSVSNPSVVTRRGGPVGHLQPGRLVVNGPRSRYRFRSKTDQSNSPAMQDSRTKTKISCTDCGWVGPMSFSFFWENCKASEFDLLKTC